MVRFIGLLAIAAILLLASCSKVKVNKNDQTPPDVVIKIRGTDGQYAPATSTGLSVAGSLDLMCIVKDSHGVSSIDLSYKASDDSCTLPGGVVTNHVPGGFPITVPSEAKQTIQPDPSGKVLTELPLLGTLKGPFKCSFNGQKGSPIGQTITVTCVGENWSGNPQDKSAKSKLAVTLQ